jgi:hypothetical protein
MDLTPASCPEERHGHVAQITNSVVLNDINMPDIIKVGQYDTGVPSSCPMELEPSSERSASMAATTIGAGDEMDVEYAFEHLDLDALENRPASMDTTNGPNTAANAKLMNAAINAARERQALRTKAQPLDVRALFWDLDIPATKS